MESATNTSPENERTFSTLEEFQNYLEGKDGSEIAATITLSPATQADSIDLTECTKNYLEGRVSFQHTIILQLNGIDSLKENDLVFENLLDNTHITELYTHQQNFQGRQDLFFGLTSLLAVENCFIKKINIGGEYLAPEQIELLFSSIRERHNYPENHFERLSLQIDAHNAKTITDGIKILEDLGIPLILDLEINQSMIGSVAEQNIEAAKFNVCSVNITRDDDERLCVKMLSPSGSSYTGSPSAKRQEVGDSSFSPSSMIPGESPQNTEGNKVSTAERMDIDSPPHSSPQSNSGR